MNPLEQAIIDLREQSISQTAFTQTLLTAEVHVLCAEVSQSDDLVHLIGLERDGAMFLAAFSSKESAGQYSEQSDRERYFVILGGKQLLLQIPEAGGVIINPGNELEVTIDPQAVRQILELALVTQTNLDSIEGELCALEKAMVERSLDKMSHEEFVKVLMGSDIVVPSKSPILDSGGELGYEPVFLTSKEDGKQRICVCTDEEAVRKFFLDKKLDSHYIVSKARPFVFNIPVECGLAIIGKKECCDISPDGIQQIINLA